MASILFVDDESSARENYRTILEHYGHEVVLAGGVGDALEKLGAGGFDLIITDMRMGARSGLDLLREARRVAPETEVIVLTGHAELDNAVEAMKLGAADYLTKDTDYREIMLVVEKAFAKRGLKREIERLREAAASAGRGSHRELVGSSAAMRQVLEVLRRVAPTDTRVLVTGESGTGKELVAETLHRTSERREGPFIAINCGAIPRDLQESELFGYVRGAFTGADRDKRGLLESADHGTVFLDEVGEMSAETQVKLLRFLEKGEIVPVGSPKARVVDARVVSATNRDLAEAIRQHEFREDLYYRLKVVWVHIPPLRERREDISPIANALLAELTLRGGHRTNVRGITDEAMAALVRYDWPGNVRELRNVLERALIFADGDLIGPEHLPEEILTHGHTATSSPTGALNTASTAITPGAAAAGTADAASLDDVERRHIIEMLERNGGNKVQTARQLNIAVTTLYRKLRMYGIE